MFIKALLMFLVTLFGQMSPGFFGDSFFNRPIFIGSIAGLILGDIRTGVMVAASVELMWVGMIFFAPVDLVVGAVLAVFVAIESGASVEVASTIAITVGLLGGQIGNLTSTFKGLFTAKAPELAEKSDVKGLCRLHILLGLIGVVLKSLLVFVAVYLGTDVMVGIVERLPENVTNALTAVGSMLPAVGFAMLLNILWDKKFLVFFVIGFTITSYLNLEIMATAILATCIAIFYFFSTEKENSSKLGVE